MDLVQDALLGSFGVRLYIDKISGELVGSEEVRKKDDVSERSSKASLVSAVLTYRRRMGNGASIKLEGDILVNPKAKNPIHDDKLKTLKTDLLPSG